MFYFHSKTPIFLQIITQQFRYTKINKHQDVPTLTGFQVRILSIVRLKAKSLFTMNLSQIMNIQTYWLLHHRNKRGQYFLCCGTIAEFLRCSAPKHPHTTLRENKIPLSKFSKGFSTTAEKKKHFCDHRWLKGLSNFTNLLIVPATDTEKSYRYHREINTVGEKNQIFSLPKVQGFI